MWQTIVIDSAKVWFVTSEIGISRPLSERTMTWRRLKLTSSLLVVLSMEEYFVEHDVDEVITDWLKPLVWTPKMNGPLESSWLSTGTVPLVLFPFACHSLCFLPGALPQPPNRWPSFEFFSLNGTRCGDGWQHCCSHPRNNSSMSMWNYWNCLCCWR